VLRQQLAVLKRKAGRPKLRRVDRMLLAAFARLIPRESPASEGSASAAVPFDDESRRRCHPRSPVDPSLKGRESRPGQPTGYQCENAAWRRPRPCSTTYRRVKVRWVTPLGALTDSTSKRSSSRSNPSQSRSPRPRTIGTTTMCR
jgi:hypothetical protein